MYQLQVMFYILTTLTHDHDRKLIKKPISGSAIIEKRSLLRHQEEI